MIAAEPSPTADTLALEKLRKDAQRPGELLVGAAIGLGMTARAAIQGGADFLVVLNAGRLRVMGAASNAALLPIREANRFTDDFARREILGRVSAPVIFGACVMDPTCDLDALIESVRAAGYAGITNFPTAIHFDGRVRALLEANGLGVGREVELLRRAKRSGLLTLGYAKTKAEISGLIAADVDMVCVNFGWNAGGSMGIGGAMDLAAASDHARRIIALLRRRHPGCLCFVEGGPVVQPKDATAVCDASGADGYIGGSTLDRLPLEMAVMQSTSAFKAAAVLRSERLDADRERSRITGIAGLIGRSEAMERLVEQVGRLARTALPICIGGEPGAGKTTVARAIHVASRAAGPFIVVDGDEPDLERKLFGQDSPGLLETPTGHLVIENIERMPPGLVASLLAWVERGVFERFLPQRHRPEHARLIVTTAGRDLRANELVARLAGHRIEVPPLRERLEDLPVLARAILAAQRRRDEPAVTIAPEGMRELMRHGWPGNVRELAALLARATADAAGGTIDAATVLGLLSERPDAPARARDEKSWSGEALARHRFRRAETAAALGISRKTLYNKMKLYGLIG